MFAPLTYLLQGLAPLLPFVALGTLAGAGALTALYARRRTRLGPRQALASATLDVALAGALAAVAILTLSPSDQAAPRRLDLLPFRELLEAGPLPPGARAQMVANVVLFIPLGLLAPARWAELDDARRVAAAGLLLAAGIEAWQLVLGSGREAAVTDVVLNAAGGVVGYALLTALRSVRERASSRPRPDLNRRPSP
jgi:hypothetical protein